MFYPIVGRLDCGKSLTDHQGFWAEDGFGLLAMYKSDWNRVGGKSNLNGKINRKRNVWSFYNTAFESNFNALTICHVLVPM